MAMTTSDLLAPQVIMGTISRMNIGQGRLATRFGWNYRTGEMPSEGWGLTGPNVRETPTRTGTYRIFDLTRTVAQGRAPDTAPAWIPPRDAGEVSYTCARFHEKMRLAYEKLNFLSKVTGVNSVIDTNGQYYIKQQEMYLAQRFNNAINLMAAGLIRGKLYFAQVGENWIPTLTLPVVGVGGVQSIVTIDLKIPAANQGQLAGIYQGSGTVIGTTWNSAGAPIISHDLPQIMKAYTINTGLQTAEAWVSPVTWAKIITNTEVINSAGSANTPFSEYGWDNAGRNGDNQQTAVLRGYPMITWHITSEVIIDNGGVDNSFAAGATTVPTQVIPDNVVVFLPPPDIDWQELLTYGEAVADFPGAPAVKRPGFYLWHETVTQPTAIEIIGLMNMVPMLKIPRAIVSPTVIF